MRKYLQLTVVLLTFFSAVFLRHLRVPERQPFLVASPADGMVPWATPTPTFQFTPRLAPTALPTPTDTAQPTPTVTEVTVVALTPSPIVMTVTPSPAVTTWPTFFIGSTFNDGAFTGKPARITYGNLQVQVVMQGGRIESVLVAEYPSRTPTSERMSLELIPKFIAQTVAIQDWNVDVVSGATQTSQAFQRAMVYALRAAEQQ